MLNYKNVYDLKEDEQKQASEVEEKIARQT